MCGDSFDAIAADLKAGTITEAEAKEQYATAHEECKAEGDKIGKACAGPKGPKPPSFMAKMFGPGPDHGPDPACAAAAAAMKKVCGDSFAAIAADLKAGTITEAQAAKAFADASMTCSAAGVKVAAACVGPFDQFPKEKFLKEKF